MLSDENETIFDAADEVGYSNLERLTGVVQYGMREHSRSGNGISDQDLYDYLVTGRTKNELLNHIVKDRLGTEIPVSEFKRSLEPLLDAKFYNKVVMMDGDEWCNYKFGPGSVHLSPKDKPVAMCIQKIEKDF